jgi:hypothetical protein
VASIRVFPEGLPAALVAGHGFEPLPNARRRERDQGESRMRPRYRSVPEMCAASWLFNQEEFDQFHDWFEDTLLAGSLDFDVRVQHRGTQFGTTWYTAIFPDGYSADVQHGILYLVTAPLLLRESLGTLRIAPGISASGGIVFEGGVRMGAFVLQASGSISFDGGARVGLTGIQAAGGISFGGGSDTEGSAQFLFREDDDGTERETDAGIAREL